MRERERGRYINNDNENGNVLYWSLKRTNQVNDVAVYQSKETFYIIMKVLDNSWVHSIYSHA